MADENKIEVGVELNLNELREDLSEAETLMQNGVARLASIGEQAEAEKLVNGGSGATTPASSASEETQQEEEEGSASQNAMPPSTPLPGAPPPPTSVGNPPSVGSTPDSTASESGGKETAIAPDLLSQSWEKLRQIQASSAVAPELAGGAAKQLQNQVLAHGIADPGRAEEWEKLIQATQDLTRSLNNKHRQDEQKRRDGDSSESSASLIQALKLGGLLTVGSQAVNSALSGNLMGAAGSIIGGGIGMLAGPAGLMAGAGIGNAIGSSVQGLINASDSARQYQINQAGVAARFGEPTDLENLGIDHFYEGEHSGYKVAESLQLADTLRQQHVVDDTGEETQRLIESIQALTRATGMNVDALTKQYASYKTSGGEGDANQYMAQVIGGAIATGFEAHTQDYADMLTSARVQTAQRATMGDEGDGALKKIQSLMLGLMGGESSTSAFLRDNPAAAQQEISRLLQSGATSQPYGYEAVAMQIAGIDASETSEAYATPDQQAENATKRMGYVLNRSLFSAEGLATLGMTRDELAAATQADPDFLRNKLSSDNPDKEQAKHLQDLVNVQFGFQYARDPKSQDIAMLTELGNVALANNGQIPLNAIAPDGQKVQDLISESKETPGQEALDSISGREDAIARGLEKLTPTLNSLDKVAESFVAGVTDLGDSLGVFESIAGASEGFATNISSAIANLNTAIENLIAASTGFQKTTENWIASGQNSIRSMGESFNRGIVETWQDPEFQEKAHGSISENISGLFDLGAAAAGSAGRWIHDRFNDTPVGGVVARPGYQVFEFAPGDIVHAKQNAVDFGQEWGAIAASDVIPNYSPSSVEYRPPAVAAMPVEKPIAEPMGNDRAIGRFDAAIARFERSVDAIVSAFRTSSHSPLPAPIAPPQLRGEPSPRGAIAALPPSASSAPPRVEIERQSLERFRSTTTEHNERFSRLAESHTQRLGAIANQETTDLDTIATQHQDRFSETSAEFNNNFTSESTSALESYQTQNTEHGDRLTSITTDHTAKFGFTTAEFNELFSISTNHFNKSYEESGVTFNKDYSTTSKAFTGDYSKTSANFNQEYKETNKGLLEGLGGWFSRMFGMLGQSSSGARTGLWGITDYASGFVGGGGSAGGNIQDALMAAVIGQESGGDYQKVNTDSGAIGLGQVMPENVPSWTQEALGRSLTPEEFQHDREAQIATLKFKLNQYYEQALEESGGDQDEAVRRVASMWYSGQSDLYNDTNPQSYNGNEYPSIDEYTRSVLEKFKAAYHQSSQASTGTSGGSGAVAPVGIRTVPGQEYGAPRDGGARSHQGEDFDLAPGQHSTSYLGGVVQEIQDWGEWGKAAVIYNAQLGVTEIVAEMREVFVQVGQQITAGTAVGTGGDDIGGVQHEEIHIGQGRTGNTVAPLDYLRSIGVDPAVGTVYGASHDHEHDRNISSTTSLRLTRTNQKDEEGLEKLRLDLLDQNGQIVDSIITNSGRANNQDFSSEGSRNNAPGSLAPIPEGTYGIGAREVSQGNINGNAAIGSYWVAIEGSGNNQQGRGDFGFHLDADRVEVPGSAGCIVFVRPEDRAKFDSWIQSHNAPNSLRVDYSQTTSSDRNISYTPNSDQKPIDSNLLYRSDDQKHVFGVPFPLPTPDDEPNIHKPAAAAEPAIFGDLLGVSVPMTPSFNPKVVPFFLQPLNPIDLPGPTTTPEIPIIQSEAISFGQLPSNTDLQSPQVETATQSLPSLSAPAPSNTQPIPSGQPLPGSAAPANVSPLSPEVEIIPFGEPLPPMRDAAAAHSYPVWAELPSDTPPAAAPTTNPQRRHQRSDVFSVIDRALDILPIPSGVRRVAEPILDFVGGFFDGEHRQHGSRHQPQAFPTTPPFNPGLASAPAIAQPLPIPDRTSQAEIIPFGEPLPPMRDAAIVTPSPIPFGQPLPSNIDLQSPQVETAAQSLPSLSAPAPSNTQPIPFGQPLPATPPPALPSPNPPEENPIAALEPLLSALIAPLNAIAKSLAERGNIAASVINQSELHPFGDYNQLLHTSASQILNAQPNSSERFGFEARGSDRPTEINVTVHVMSGGGRGGSADIREQARQGAFEGAIAARDEFADRWDEGNWDRRNQPRMRTRIH